jgi:FkbM family methyltransferase
MLHLRRTLTHLNKPWYIFRPQQVLRRVSQGRRRTNTVRLPWHVSIHVFPDDTIGSAVRRTGIFDLAVAEALWRLAEPGELALDVGANIGYMTSLLGARVGPTGQVISFEPNPQVLPILNENIGMWKEVPHMAGIQLHPVGLSDRQATAVLSLAESPGNMGTAHLLDHSDPDGNGVEIAVDTLDGLLGPEAFVGILKLDVEGHELEVLRGGEHALTSGRIRDIVYEDHQGFDSDVRRLLERHGYRIFGLSHCLLRLKLTLIGERFQFPVHDAPNLVATLDPDRAIARMRRRGWRSLHPRVAP